MSPGSVVGFGGGCSPLGFALVVLRCDSSVSVLLVGRWASVVLSLAFRARVLLVPCLVLVVPSSWHLAGFDLVSPRFPHGLGLRDFSGFLC